MPRNGSGNMTAPGSYPPAAGSTISLADYKALIDDIVAELTDSLSRSGKGGMSNPLKLADGTPAAPSLAFTNGDNTGIYKPVGLNELRAAVAGVLVAKLTAAGMELPGVATLGGIAGTVTDNTTLEVNANALRIKDGGVTAVKTNAVSAATASRLVVRDANGRAQFAAPSAAADAATKGYADSVGIVAAALISGGGGTPSVWRQQGSVVMSVAAAGAWPRRVTIPGFTTNGIVAVTPVNASNYAVVTLESGSIVVTLFDDSTNSSVYGDFTVLVAAL